LHKNMRLTELHLAIMSRDECTQVEADKMVKEMRKRVKEGEDPEEILWEYGFEPDYIFDISRKNDENIRTN
jgi:hypothetical protein